MSWGKESIDEGRPVLGIFEPVLDDRGELVHVGGRPARGLRLFQTPLASFTAFAITSERSEA
jgi:hypothetical protein